MIVKERHETIMGYKPRERVATGEEHALVRDDSYRDVSQILSL